MAKRIIIVGGLPGDPPPNDFLDRMRARSGTDIEWDWHRGSTETHYDVDQRAFGRLIHELNFAKSKKQHDSIRVVKLRMLHGRAQARLYSACEPVLVPDEVTTIELLEEWLFSAEANLIPHLEMVR
jgi:hypothetical protein